MTIAQARTRLREIIARHTEIIDALGDLQHAAEPDEARRRELVAEGRRLIAEARTLVAK